MIPAVSSSSTSIELVALRAADLDAVVALDKKSSGLPRRAYFEKRLAAALARPKRHVQLALRGEHGLVGFLLARRAGGEFGRPTDLMELETIGVDPDARGLGLGQRLLRGLEEWMNRHGITRLETEVDWTNHRMLKFLAGGGFALAPRLVLERGMTRVTRPGELEEEEPAEAPLVRRLRADDLAAIQRIDQRITGQNRGAYLETKLEEVLHESAMEVSLVVENDSHPAGFVMARVDYGDFGHIDPSARLETIGVDPRFARRGLGSALMAQLVENLTGLLVERIETEVASDRFELLGFLYGLGFGPSQRLCFQRSI